MIYYFSGSGNTRAVAEGLGRRLGCDIEKVGSQRISDEGDLGLVLPVYAWGVPPHILKWLKQVEITGNISYVWCVLTYGDEAAYAARMLRKTLYERGLTLDAVWGVQMPNTYVLLPGFDIDKDNVSSYKLKAASPRLDTIAEGIRSKKRNVEDIIIGSIPQLKSGLVYFLFKKFGITTSRWHVDVDKCIGCKACEKACPMHNIMMINSHPVYSGDGTNCGLYMSGGNPSWDNKCSSCLACYHACPENAISYGKITRHKGQWRHWFVKKDINL